MLIAGKDEDERAEFTGDLNAASDPETEALNALAAHMAQMRGDPP